MEDSRRVRVEKDCSLLGVVAVAIVVAVAAKAGDILIGVRSDWTGEVQLNEAEIKLSIAFPGIKQAFEARRQDNVKRKEEKRKSAAMGAGACRSHTHLYCFSQGEDANYQCLSGMSGDGVAMKQPESPMSREAEVSLSLVQISAAEPSKENGGIMWTSSPDRLELPRKPFHRSNSSGSPCMSESGPDIYSKREVIQKLRQQLKRRDEMIMEMQSQITDLQNSISIQMAQCTRLQSQADATNRDLFDSEREIQRLRKIIADHYAAELASPDKAARN